MGITTDIEGRLTAPLIAMDVPEGQMASVVRAGDFPSTAPEGYRSPYTAFNIGNSLTEKFQTAVRSDLGQKVLDKGNVAFDFLNNTAKGNILGSALWGAGSAVIALATGASGQEAMEEAIGEAVPFGDAGVKAMQGDKRGAVLNTMTEVAGLGGSAIGGAIGTFVCPIPGVGTVVGAAIGGYLADEGAEWLLEAKPELAVKAENTYDVMSAFAKSATETTGSTLNDIASSIGGFMAAPVTLMQAQMRAPGFTQSLS